MNIKLRRLISNNWIDILFALIIIFGVLTLILTRPPVAPLAYLAVILALAILSAATGERYVRIKSLRRVPLKYDNVPAEEKIFFEITSDIVGQMRKRIGDQALKMASEIKGLRIDKRTGRILNITKDPSEVIAMLIYRYEKFLGMKILATPEPLGKNLAGILRPVNQNLSIIEKYFKPNSK